MPRRGSRAQLIHMLADAQAFAYREVYGDRAYPQDFYDDFQHLGTAELRELAAGISARGRGRPKGWWGRKHSSIYARLFPAIDEALRSGKRTERGACQFVAQSAGVCPDTLRTKYR